MLGDGSNSSIFDAENRLTAVTNGGVTSSYTYDDSGIRVRKVSGSPTTVFIFKVGWTSRNTTMEFYLHRRPENTFIQMPCELPLSPVHPRLIIILTIFLYE